MTVRIAVAGKGGTGKSTFVALTINRLIARGIHPILAVDADPNSNLDVLLGLHPENTIADLREKFREMDIPPGMSKTEYLELQLEQAIVEGEKVDLLVMGRPEGPGCYCAVNELLRIYLSKLGRGYKIVIMDTEAGMEHLSRRTTDNLNHLFIMSDPTRVALDSARRIYNLAGLLGLHIKDIWLVINRSRGDIEKLDKYIRDWYTSEVFQLPECSDLMNYVEEGGDFLSLKKELTFGYIFSYVDDIIDKTILKEKEVKKCDGR